MHDWRIDADGYGAIHFHSDDLYDAGWPTAFQLDVPASWRSGMYAARITAGSTVEYVVFFVAPPLGSQTADVAFLEGDPRTRPANRLA